MKKSLDDPLRRDFEPAETCDVGGLQEVWTNGAGGSNRVGHSGRNVGLTSGMVNAGPITASQQSAAGMHSFPGINTATWSCLPLDAPFDPGVSPMHPRLSIPLAAIALAACGGSQPSGPLSPETRLKQQREAATSITAATVFQRISVIAHDSMGGRNTPSPGLEKTAAYLAGMYERWGLKPAGDNGTWFQRYPLVRSRFDPAGSLMEVNEAGTVTRYRLDRWAQVSGPRTGQSITGAMRVLSGAITATDVAKLDLAGRIVMFVQNSERAADNRAVLTAIRGKVPSAIIVLQAGDPAQFAAGVQRATAGNQVLGGVPVTGVPTLTIHDSIFAGDPNVTNRPDWNTLRVSPTAVVMDVPDQVTVTLRLAETEISRVTAPNVVAMIEGSDPLLRNEYVVYSAHMDHVGTVGDGVGGCGVQRDTLRGTVDSICNGADDDASGTIGIAMIAEAFARLKVKPMRSIIILNVSGEEKGLLGAQYFAENPTVSREQIIANLNFDMIGRNNPDSIVVIGKEHSDLGGTLAAVSAQHPELRLIAADDIWPNERFYFRSDHYQFARKGIPILFFFNGVHPQYHRPSDEVSLIDTSKLARIATLGFYLGNRIANTMVRPKWNPDSYTEIVQGAGR